MRKTTKVFLIIAAVLIAAGSGLMIAGAAGGASLSVPFRGQGVFADMPSRIEHTEQSDVQWMEAGTADAEQSPSVLLDEVDSDIRSIHIEWISGHVEFVLTDEEKIGLAEQANEVIPEKYGMKTGVRGNELHVQFMEEQAVISSVPDKTLTVFLPRTMAESMSHISVSSTSADFTISGITAEKLSFNSASGNLNATEMTVGQVALYNISGDLAFSGVTGYLNAGTTSGDISVHQSGERCEIEAETMSGNVKLTGNYSDLDAVSASGWVSVEVAVITNDLEIETLSGDVELIVSQNSSMQLEFETVSGRLDSDLTLSKQGDSYVLNGRGPEYEVSTTSGNLRIKAK